MCELSVVIPVYNVEKYIQKCFDSIIAQTFRNFEVIIVDDGSTDSSAEIIDRYVSDNKMFKCIRQRNMGVSAARNTGLRAASGQFVSFVDPDDWIDERMFELMMSEVHQENYDVVCCNWVNYDDENNKVIYHSIKDDFELNDNSDLLLSTKIIGRSVWNKIFRLTLVENEFPEDMEIGEDWVFLANYCTKKLKVKYINMPLYCYRSRVDSAVNHNKQKRCIALLANIEVLHASKKISNKCYQQVERDFLDSCLLHITDLPVDDKNYYYKLSKHIFCAYIKDNLFSVCLNNEIGIKQRILYMIKYMEWKNQLKLRGTYF